MNLILEKSTGRLVPPGVPGELARGGTQPLSLQFLDAGVAGLLGGGAPIALKLFAPDDTDTPLVSITEWTADAAKQRYTATLNTLAGALAWVQAATYLARVDYNDPGESSALFHLVYGQGAAAASPVPQVVVNQITTVGKFLAPLMFTGKLTSGQIFGYYKAKTAGHILGIQLAAQTAPTGADVQVDLVDAGDTALGKVATLTAGTKVAETMFGAPLVVAVGDVIRAKILQVGSGTAGGYLTANLICENS